MEEGKKYSWIHNSKKITGVFKFCIEGIYVFQVGIDEWWIAKQDFDEWRVRDDI